jgi:hypothetical protein
MNEELVVVDAIAGRIEAEILQSYLHARGIECMLSQEAAGWVYGFAVGDMARVQVLVPASHQREARQMIEDFYATQDRDES